MLQKGLSSVSDSIGSVYRAWERCWRPAPRRHAHGSRRGEGDAGARDLCPGGVRQGERRGDGDGGAAGGGRLSRSPYPETHPQRRTYAVYTPSIRSQLSNANLTFAGVRGRVSVF